MSAPLLACSACLATYPTDLPRWRCDCGSYLTLAETAMFQPGDLPGRATTVWRYREALGFATSPTVSPVTLGEGWTPLIDARVAGADVLLKMDFLCPSGSYKDRGTTAMITKFVEWGIRELVEDSSGNAGASVAAYSAAAGLRASIFMPERNSVGKAAQVTMYGARLVRVAGNREDCARAAMQEGERTFYGSHNWSPYFLSGLKTVAYEIAEQLAWRSPDWVILPLGAGSNLIGLYRGFAEMIRAGIVSTMPRLAAVQSENCAPVYQAWKAGLADVPEICPGSTIAEGIAIAKPVKGPDIIKALRESRGIVSLVSDTDIWRGMEELAHCGAYTEPTGSVAAAALAKMLQERMIRPDERVVLVLTGSGLKATDRIGQYLTLRDESLIRAGAG